MWPPGNRIPAGAGSLDRSAEEHVLQGDAENWVSSAEDS